MFFSCGCLLLYRSYVLLCKRGITPYGYYLLKVRIQYTKIAFMNLAYIKGYGIEVIILPTQHPVRMALLFSFFKNYRPYTLQLFFTTATIFSTVSYTSNDFQNDFLRKILVKIVVVCEGLYMYYL